MSLAKTTVALKPPRSCQRFLAHLIAACLIDVAVEKLLSGSDGPFGTDEHHIPDEFLLSVWNA